MTQVKDPERLEALRLSKLLDSKAERSFDRMTEIVCRLLDVPVSLISLVDADRQFFKSAQGLQEPFASRRETPLSHSFCKHVVESGEALRVEDARNEPLLAANLAIRDLRVVAYLGVPLFLPGGRVAGSLCAIDTKPKSWTESDRALLSDLADAVMAEIAVRQLLAEHTEARAKLAKREEQLRLAVNVAGMGLIDWHFGTDETDVNEVFRAFYRPEPGEAVTWDGFLSRVHPGDVDKLEHVLDAANDISEAEFRLLSDQGERWMRGTTRLLRDEGGQAERLIGATFDITEEKRLRLALEESEETFSRAFETAACNLALLSLKDWRLTEANESYLRDFGLERQSAIGTRVGELISWADPDERESFIEAILTTGSCRNMEARFKGSSGELQHHLISAQIITIRDEQIVLTTGQNITELKRYEASLQSSEEKFSKIFQNSPFGIVLEDDEGRILDVNEQFLHDTGYRREDLLGSASLRLWWASEQDVQEAARQLEEQGRLNNFKMQFRKKSGELGWALTSAEFFEQAGRRYLIRTKHDITPLQRMEHDLQEERGLLRTLLNTLPDYIMVKDRDSRFVLANQSTCEHMKSTPEAIIGSSDYDYYPKHLADDYFHKEQSIMRTGEPLVNHEERNISPEGETKWVITTKVPLRNRQGEIVGVVGSSRDISDLKKADQALRESEERFRVVTETASDAIITIDAKGIIHYVNPSTERMFDHSEEALIGRPITRLMPDYLREVHESALERYLVTGLPAQDWSGLEITGLHKDGHEFPLEISVSEFWSKRARYFTVIIRDTSERHLLLNKLEHLAYHDTLTQLPNRALLREQLEQDISVAKTKGHRLALMFMDLDNFKIINDSLGHEFGDKLLQLLARRLSGAVHSDDLVARLGGDEFVVLLNAVKDTNDVVRLAKKLLKLSALPYKVDDHEVRLRSSVGIALYPSDGTSSSELLKSADLAMYQAKQEKGTFKFFTRELNERVQDRLTLERELRQALEQGDIRVHFQPRIQLSSGRIVGSEALARWTHPSLGSISPARFIPIAEEAGLIHPLGMQVLEQACRQLKRWHDLGFSHLKVSVNLAAQQLHRPNLLANIEAILSETGLAPSILELEVTESTAMGNVQESSPVLASLRDLGVRISVDDFGTGYSSLSYLKQLPVDTLKIDRSFLRDIGKADEDLSDIAIVRVIIALAKNLNLNVVAEGIETPDQLAFVRELDCPEAQGFLFSQPLPPDQLEASLRQSQTLQF